MRMMLARKGLIDHIIAEKGEVENSDEWRRMDMKAFAIIAQGVEVEHQSKIRNASTAREAWVILREYYNRSNLQNRITLTRKLHDFRMEEGTSMATHLDRFGELVTAMEAVGGCLASTCDFVGWVATRIRDNRDGDREHERYYLRRSERETAEAIR